MQHSKLLKGTSSLIIGLSFISLPLMYSCNNESSSTEQKKDSIPATVVTPDTPLIKTAPMPDPRRQVPDSDTSKTAQNPPPPKH